MNRDKSHESRGTWIERELNLSLKPENRERRRKLILQPIAFLAIVLAPLNFLTSPHTVESRTVTVSGPVNPGEPNAFPDVPTAVCDTAEDMTGRGFDKAGCLQAMSGFEVPNGTELTIEKQITPIGLVNGRIAIGRTNIKPPFDNIV